MENKSQTPGALLKALLIRNGMTGRTLAGKIHVSHAFVYYVCQGKNRVSVHMACRLARFFGTTPEYWLTAQMKVDIEKAENKKTIQKVLARITPMGKKPGSPQTS